MVQMYARTLLLQQQQQQLLLLQQLFEGGRPQDPMATYGLDGGRINPAAANQGPVSASGKPNVRLPFCTHFCCCTVLGCDVCSCLPGDVTCTLLPCYPGINSGGKGARALARRMLMQIDLLLNWCQSANTKLALDAGAWRWPVAGWPSSRRRGQCGYAAAAATSWCAQRPSAAASAAVLPGVCHFPSAPAAAAA